MLHSGLQRMGERTVKKTTSSGRDAGRQASSMAMDPPPAPTLSIRPADAVGLLIAAAASGTILVNALFLQTGTRPEDVQEPAGGYSEAPAVASPGVDAPAAASVPAANPLVKEVQAELSRRGFYEGTVDGLMGRNTQAAIKAYENGAGIAVTGEATPQLLSALRQPTREASASDEVLQVQRALVRLGIGAIKADGALGEATRAAIRRFETSRGMKPNGEITPALKKALFAAAPRT